MFKKLLLSFGVLLFVVQLSAQETAYYADRDAIYRQAQEYYSKSQYNAAQKLFKQYVELSGEEHSELRINAEYYIAVCALELYHRDGEQLVNEFVTAHPANPRVQQINLFMASHMFDRRKYSDAIEWYEKVEYRRLRKEELYGYHFKLGYSYFMREDYENANKNFSIVSGANSKYANSAKYYSAHIAYQNGNDQTALSGFQSIAEDPNYGPIVPYYITQIFYNQKEYGKLVETGEKLLQVENVQRVDEIYRLMGEAYLKEDKPAKAVEYFEKYVEIAKGVQSEDYYQMGLAYYGVQSYDKAIGMFNKIVNRRDSIAQNAYYHLADCYLQQGQKPEAQNAFASVAELDYNHELTEVARFNYAKLSYEVGNPYSDPGRELQKFIDDYPESRYNEEANRYLVSVYLNTKDYERALSAMENLPMNDVDLQKAYQKIAYFRGVELFNNRMWQGAIDYFDKSFVYKADQKVFAKGLYWKAEALYNQKRYEAAIEAYLDFLASGLGDGEMETAYANYSLGYAYFQKKDYQKAATYFARFVKDASVSDKKQLHDGYLRLADSYFVTKGYYTAISNYEGAIRIGGSDVDYAYFQKALCLGLLGKNTERINELNALIQNYPSSDFVDDAWFELGNSYLLAGNNDKALEAYRHVQDDFENSFYERKSLMQRALIHYNTGNNDRALEVCEMVVNTYPSTSEANQAVELAEKIYSEKNDIEAYAVWVEQLDFAQVTTGELDTLSYDAAYDQYVRANCGEAIRGFAKYIDRYADGAFILQAHYYKAECEYKAENFETALQDYEYVVERNPNNFSERALLRSSYMYYKNEDFAMAVERYAELERIAQFPANLLTARIGLMRANFKLAKYDQALKYADLVRGSDKVEKEVVEEARIIIAKSAFEEKDVTRAKTELQWVEKNAKNVFKAEAKYYLALMAFEEGKYEDSQAKIFELLKELPSYKYWGNRALILLAKNYWKLEDVFQATYTLEQVIQRVENPEVKEEAEALLLQIEAYQLEQETLNETDTIQLDSVNTNGQ